MRRESAIIFRMDNGKRQALIDQIIGDYIEVVRGDKALTSDRWNQEEREVANRAAALYLDCAVGMRGIMHGISRPLKIVAHPGQRSVTNGHAVEFEEKENGIALHLAMAADALPAQLNEALTTRLKEAEKKEADEHPVRGSDRGW